jgi:hypothetical protein
MVDKEKETTYIVKSMFHDTTKQVIRNVGLSFKFFSTGKIKFNSSLNMNVECLE